MTISTVGSLVKRVRRGSPAPPMVRVRVRGGFVPDTIVARAGEPLRLVFHREETASCSELVTFPDVGLTVMLPVREDVVVDLLLERPGQYEFTCQLGLLRGRILVTSNGWNANEGRRP